MIRIKRRYVKEKEARTLLSKFSKRIKMPFSNIAKLSIEIAEINDEEIFLISRKPVFAKFGDNLIPTILSGELLSNLPRAVVNMGAVPYVCNGADVMAPGIVNFKGFFNKGDLILVVDERHQKPIAVTKSLFTSEEAEKLEKGKVLVNIHYVGDKLWEIIKKL